MVGLPDELHDLPLVDTHMHLEYILDDRFDLPDDAVLASLFDLALDGPFAVITSCCDAFSIETTVRLVQLGAPHVFAAFGAHPKRALGDWDSDMRELLLDGVSRCPPNSVVAWGECGLDFAGYEPLSKYQAEIAEQKRIFRENIQIAVDELKLPMQLHSRDCEQDFLDCLIEYMPRLHPFHWHAAIASPAALERVLSLFPNAYFGIGGYIAFGDARSWSLLNQMEHSSKKPITSTDPVDSPTASPRSTCSTLSTTASSNSSSDEHYESSGNTSSSGTSSCENVATISFSALQSDAAEHDVLVLDEDCHSAVSSSPGPASGIEQLDDDSRDSTTCKPLLEDSTTSKKPVENETVDLVEMVRRLPLDRILLETDSPHFTVFSGGPADVLEVAASIAGIKNLSVEEVVRACTENARRLYGIDAQRVATTRSQNQGTCSPGSVSTSSGTTRLSAKEMRSEALPRISTMPWASKLGPSRATRLKMQYPPNEVNTCQGTTNERLSQDKNTSTCADRLLAEAQDEVAKCGTAEENALLMTGENKNIALFIDADAAGMFLHADARASRTELVHETQSRCMEDEHRRAERERESCCKSTTEADQVVDASDAESSTEDQRRKFKALCFAAKTNGPVGEPPPVGASLLDLDLSDYW
ncbi:unnamed protein product [Amoebophrya sp. A25]|nr:unnamed protein product [Amoebophrya sp. A25]|eukprot:GSA25T00022734001.1